MAHFNYADVVSFLHDEDLIHLLCANQDAAALQERLSADDFLSVDRSVKIPFFAEVRDYVGAVEKGDATARWIVKPLDEAELAKAAAGAICFFLDFSTHTVSAPTTVTRIDGKLYKATKVVMKAEQLSGANYTDIPQLKEQLVLDLVNRWIYFDEDRNPNNYMIHYTSRGDQVVIAIDYSNVDLVAKDMKIKGRPGSFGWERTEKTRYLTPLKVEHFQGYDMEFFNMRFDGFRALGKKQLLELCKICLRFVPNHVRIARDMTDNLVRRIAYVSGYFESQFPAKAKKAAEDKYKDMGSTFGSIYGKKG